MHLIDGYGSTEAGIGARRRPVQRPPVIDYKLVDVPDLGYFSTDRPHPRGELLVKSDELFPGYYKRPRSPPRCSTPTATTAPATSSPRSAPDQLVYVDRRNNVLKLSQGEFVTVSKLEAAFGDSPLVRQIYVYGNSARPTCWRSSCRPRTRCPAAAPTTLKPLITESLQNVAKAAGLQSYEIPRDFIVETTPFTLENGLLTGIRKLARPKLKEHYGERLEQLYAELADSQADELRALRQQRRRPAGAGDRQPGRGRAARRVDGRRGARRPLHRPRRRLVVGVDVRQPAARDLRRRRARRRDRQPGQRPAGDRRLHRGGAAPAAKRPTFASVHGRGATEVHAARSDAGQVPRREHHSRRPRRCRARAPRSARCCSPARPDSSAATWHWSGWSGWTWSTAR